jgi:hypothetical protein
MECADLDITFYTGSGQYTEDCPAGKWSRLLSQGLEMLGMEPRPCQKLEGWMRDAGFRNITYRRFTIPLGPWPKDKKMVSLLSNRNLLLICVVERNWEFQFASVLGRP